MTQICADEDKGRFAADTYLRLPATSADKTTDEAVWRFRKALQLVLYNESQEMP
jgi:hypothetical protein